MDYGATFFMIFPFAVGFSIGTLNKKERQISYLLFGLLIFFGFLLAGALEGLVCVLMASPIFALMVFLGYKVQEKVFRREVGESKKLLVSFLPLLILLAINPIEQMILPEPSVTTIENSITLDYAPDLVFDEVKQMDKLDANKPLGLMLGLPTPYKCELEADSIGAKRNCLFSNGKIIAQITKFEKGVALEMDVIDYTLTGRDWFEFVDAQYTFEEIDGKTKITRTSSYKSILNPRIYWEPLERWGIEQEHEFVLNSLKKNLTEKYGR
ncbi:MAG: hypothetical protein R2792_14715 [Saprospiraceae bacterium]